jgi:thymidylate synthase
MHEDYDKDGMSDFMCTNAVQYMIRDGLLEAHVQMRSNDVWAGYRNDYAWQKYIQKLLADKLQIQCGNIYWNAGSLHCYEKNFWMIDCYAKFGKSLSKKEYEKLISQA